MPDSPVKDGYNKAADAYLQGRSQFEGDRYLDKLALLLKPQASVLDLGCGAGIPVDRYLVDRGFRVAGLDISEKQIELARASVPGATFAVADMRGMRAGDDIVMTKWAGIEGSAVAGLRECRVQHRSVTPMPLWNPDLPVTERYRDQWDVVPDNGRFDNGFKYQWEEFVRHVVEGTPFPYDLLSGARGVQLAELGLTSWRERRWVDVTELPL